jgi:hypothetical protein
MPTIALIAANNAPALEFVSTQDFANAQPVLEVTFLESVPFAVVTTANAVYAISLEEFEGKTTSDLRVR